MSFSTTNLKTAQLQAVHRMLAFNEEVATTTSSESSGNGSKEDDFLLPPSGASHNQWKILVYDAACRSIISPLLSVSQLRRRGVTLHLLLNSERESIPDVPVVYFCQPTKENCALIAQDCAKRIYGKAHINFVTKLDRSLMEEFAKLVVQTECLDVIASIHDQYLDYVCLEKNLFSLHKANSYVRYNGASAATEQSVEAVMTEIAYGLFSVVATMGQVPMIRCPKGGAPEMVARKLNRMIAEHPTLLRSKIGHSRPLLVILDRNSDLITPLQHTSTYQALIDDVLTHRANRVEFVVTQDPDSKRPKKIPKKFDLDPDQDPFYVQHKFQPFPEAIESNGVELEEVSTREQEIRSSAVTSSSSGGDPMAVAGTTDLAHAVDSLPALLDRKKQLEVHTSILQAVMNEVAARDVPQFYELESSLALGTYKNDLSSAKKEVLTLISNKGSVEDKLRLLLVYSLATGAKTVDIDEVTEALKTAMSSQETTSSADKKLVQQKLTQGLQAISYIKTLRSMNMLSVMSTMESDADSSNDNNAASFMTKAATGFLAKATDRVASMLGKIHKHPATLVVEHLCEMKPNTEDDDYLYLDPKIKGEVDVMKLRTMNRPPIREVICFMIGGGCYGEYQNLQLAGSSSGSSDNERSISYGSTELFDSAEFMSQLAQLSG